MRAYIIQSKKKIEPFNEHPRDCLIENKKLITLQNEVLRSIGLELIFIQAASQINDLDEHLTLSDNLYFTRSLLEEFIIESQKRRSETICALKSNIITLRTVVATQDVKIYPDRVEYNLYYSPKQKLREKCEPLIINSEQIYTGISIPQHICGNERYLIPITEKAIIQIDHWVNLWAANIIALLEKIAKLKKTSKIKLIVLALKSRSFNQWKMLSQLNKIGRNCDIHPTAYIEGSIIDDNVIIGAGSIIRESIIGKNAFVGNGVVIEGSVVGARSTIYTGHIIYSVLYPGTFTVAQMVSASLIGKNTFIGSNVTLTDFRLDGQSVIVIKGGVKVNTGNQFIGSCLGHGVYLGSGCIIAPGRIIQQGVCIAPNKNRMISSCNHDVPGFRFIKR
jgi:acetyltransferase-like isoleucine patch superfamily enzyme